MLLKEIIIQGWEALMRNRLRSALTMLGIVWGLVSVVVLLAYGEGVGSSVLNAFLSLGNDVIMMWPGQTSMQAGGERAGRRIKFTYDDVEAVREQVPIARNVSAETDNNLGYKFNNRVISVTTKAIEYPYGAMRKLDVEDGRYFDESDFTEGRHVVIFGEDAARKVFNGLPAVGTEVDVQGMRFEVIGVLRKKVQDSSNNCPDNQCAFIPFPLMRDVTNPPQRDPDMMVFQPVSGDQNKRTIAAVLAVLAERHHFDPKDDKAAPTWDTVENAQEMRQFNVALDVLLGLIGALTLGVGGVGVMNIMLVSVTERTREIGLRKAVGARPRHILMQFLAESLVLTFAGGIVGMLLAVMIAHAVPPMPLYSDMYKTANHEGDIFLHTSAMVMTVSFLILTIVGVCSGFWPALKAARLNPIEALHYE